MNKNKNYYEIEMDTIISELYSYRYRNAKNRKLYETIALIIMIILIFLPILTCGLIATFIGNLYAFLCLLICWGTIVIWVIIRKKKIRKESFKVPEAYKLFNIIEFDSNTIDELQENNALVFYGIPDYKFLDFLYNMFNNCNALKQKNINLYKLKVKDIRDKYNFDYKEIDSKEALNETDIFCIRMSDLIINDENIEEFSYIIRMLKVQYFDDFSKYVCETKMVY